MNANDIYRPTASDTVLHEGSMAAWSTSGTTVRDEIAIRIFAALGADPNICFDTPAGPTNPWPWMARQAYVAADALIAASTEDVAP